MVAYHFLEVCDKNEEDNVLTIELNFFPMIWWECLLKGFRRLL